MTEIVVTQATDITVENDPADAIAVTVASDVVQITVPQQGPRGVQGEPGDAGLVTSVANRVGDVTIGTADIEDASADGRMLITASYGGMRTQLSLQYVNNTADLDKPISTATQAALNLKANLSGGAAFSGTVTVPNQSAGDNSTKAANTAYVEAAVAALAAIVSGALIFKGSWDASSGAFPSTAGRKQGWFYKVSVAGTVDGVSFSVGDDIYALVDTASTTTYANNWLKVEGSITLAEIEAAVGFAFSTKANLASPAFTGNPTAPTQSQGDNSTKLATTAYVDTGLAAVGGTKTGFSAHKNNITQNINNSGDQKVQFATELFDYGSHYDTSLHRWTPPAGLVILNAAIYVTSSLQVGSYFYLSIYKNGSVLKYSQEGKAQGDDGRAITVLDYADGDDYYEVFAYGVNNTGGAFTIGGAAYGTYFSGIHVRN